MSAFSVVDQDLHGVRMHITVSGVHIKFIINAGFGSQLIGIANSFILGVKAQDAAQQRTVGTMASIGLGKGTI